MVLSFLSALGGVGLFLIGMFLLTSGLKAIAGHRMREILGSFTSTPLSGATTGALTTAVIQSSSATTVAVVGFVASGLLTFPQALGIIFGANLGTTLTGWFVAILGFKLDLGQIALPFVFLGAVLSLAFKGRTAHIGKAVAGFSLIFIGIDHMQQGLDAFSGVVTPTDFPPDTIFGRLQLVLLGILITLVTQSSSAGVATALAALGAGAINFPQAAALVIGMDIGTTFTAVLATVGGGTMAKRTGYAHVIYNIMTGTAAFFLLGPFGRFAAPLFAGDAQIALVAFHTSFNLLGVVLVLPFAVPFARFIEFLVPDKSAPLTRSLDPAVLGEPDAATGLATQTVEKLTNAITAHLRARLGASVAKEEEFEPDGLESAIEETRSFLDRIAVTETDEHLLRQIRSGFHILDHLDRLLYRCSQSDRLAELSQDDRLQRFAILLLRVTADRDHNESSATCEQTLNRLQRILRRQREIRRNSLISDVASNRIAGETVWIKLDAMRWLHRVSYHLWRIQLHLNTLNGPDAIGITSLDEARIDVDQD
ncbi:MAG: Na/Pi symporter [Roseibium sp.]|uniref:Na/Pi cotransporter family protein n=1 Tax=Roseibium sp. TaxID=1936156 RepID=UPI00260F527C|nr:Na/Pi symporter [Roseibium sp.]MCV0425691.1 Na/Pi symporter [Roseibium sp.]